MVAAPGSTDPTTGEPCDTAICTDVSENDPAPGATAANDEPSSNAGCSAAPLYTSGAKSPARSTGSVALVGLALAGVLVSRRRRARAA
jgi:MYXO-CTERM domain-containing protein